MLTSKGDDSKDEYFYCFNNFYTKKLLRITKKPNTRFVHLPGPLFENAAQNNGIESPLQLKQNSLSKSTKYKNNKNRKRLTDIQG